MIAAILYASSGECAMVRVVSVFIVAAMTVCLSAQASAQQSLQEEIASFQEETASMIHFKVDVATRSIALTRVASSLLTGSTIGRFSKCLFGELLTDLHPEDAFERTLINDYSQVFLTEAGSAGYKLAAREQGNLFEEGGATKAEIQIGAGITSLRLEGCYGEGLVSRKTEIEGYVLVDWQVFDPLQRKLLYRVSKQGYVKLKRDGFSERIVIEGAREAFKNSARALLIDKAFIEAVKDPRGGAPAADGILFPEATNAAPMAATQIARLPLSTTDFRTSVKDIQQQVATILTPGGTGSGFYISRDLLLTNHHVIAGYTDVRVSFFGGRQIAGTVIATDARRDIALVRTESQAFAGLPLRLENPPLASQVFVIGSPLGQENEGSVSAGIVSAFRDHEYGPMIQSDVGVTHGNSGGPMFDEKGNVIGLTDIGLTDQNGGKTQVNLFIPIADGLKKLNIELGPDPATAQK